MLIINPARAFWNGRDSKEKSRVKRYRKLYRQGKLSADIIAQYEAQPGFPGWGDGNVPISECVAARKELILSKLRNGEKPLSKHAGQLWAAFANYTSPLTGAYDEDFVASVAAINPDYIRGYAYLEAKEIAAKHEEQKQALLLLAPDSPRPSLESELGKALRIFTKNTAANKHYCSEFTTKIKALFPHWFRMTISFASKPTPAKRTPIVKERLLMAKPKYEVGADFSNTAKTIVTMRNRQKYGGETVCEHCGDDLKEMRAKGNKPHVDHKISKFDGGTNHPDNGQILCTCCNLAKSHRSEYALVA